MRRNAVALLLWTACCAGLAAAYVGLTTPDYIAPVQLVLEHRQEAPDGPDAGPRVEQLALDGQQVETQLRLIRSDSVLRYVFDALAKPDAPDVFGRGHDIVGRRDAFTAFAARVSARRVGLSYVVEIAYRAPDPREAARIANSIAAAYIRDRVGSAVEDAQVGSPYLKSRIDAILTEAILAAGDVRIGMVPGRYLPDADVRILGPAIEPTVRTYPKFGPCLALALGFGLLSGLVAITIRQQVRGTIRSRPHFCSRFAIDCIDVTLDRGRVLAGARLRAFVRTVGRAPDPDGAARSPVIGVVSWSNDPACTTVAAGLTSLLTAVGPPAVLIDLDQDDRALGRDASRPCDLTRLAADLRSRSRVQPTVLALPALDRSFDAQASAPLMDVVILVVAAHRTTVADVEAAQLALRTMGASFAAAILTSECPKRHDLPWVGQVIGRVVGRVSISDVHRDA